MEILDRPGLTILVERIAHAPILREHHVWEAARALSINLRDQSASSSARRVGDLIAAGAMLDAVLILTAMSEPRRFVTSIRNVKRRWSCTVQVEPIPTRKTVRTFSAAHEDLPAAILMSFILSFLKGHVDSRRRAAPQKEFNKGLEHHDT